MDPLHAARVMLPFGSQILTMAVYPITERVARITCQLLDGSAQTFIYKETTARELRLYREVLSPAETGAPRLLGGREAGDRSPLLLEALSDTHPDFREPAVVEAVYGHLAAMHGRFAGRLLPAADPGNTGPGEGSLWAGSPWAVTPADIQWVFGALPELAPHAKEAAALLGCGPTTLVQGDYYRWNLILEGDRVRVVDWEHAAAGHPVWDLVMLAPEEPGWDGVPVGDQALAALRTYHGKGLLAALAWPEFLRLQQLARLFVAARWALHHEARVAMTPPGPAADVIQDYAKLERDRIRRLASLLGWPS